MAQFNCEICGQGFEQKSRYERHLMTSHPEQAPSAADLEKAIAGIDFPKTRDELVDFASGEGSPEAIDILESLPDRQYRDSAEVSRALGEIRSHQPKAQHQPSKVGGERAMESLSSARITSLFSGLSFPASNADLEQHAKESADEEEMRVIEAFEQKTYGDMADVAKEVGRVTSSR